VSGGRRRWLLQDGVSVGLGLRLWLPWPILRVAATSSFPLAYRLPNPLVSLHTSTHDSRGDPAAMLAPHPRVRSSSSSMRTPFVRAPSPEFPPASASMCAAPRRHRSRTQAPAPGSPRSSAKGVTLSPSNSRGRERRRSPPPPLLASRRPPASPLPQRHCLSPPPSRCHLKRGEMGREVKREERGGRRGRVRMICGVQLSTWASLSFINFLL
jgi:hypothetical protein